MNEQTINEQYARIEELLRQERLKEAISLSRSLLSQSQAWELNTRLEQVQTTYSYMLDYLRKGVEDPTRAPMYNKLLADVWEIAEQTRTAMNDRLSTRRFHEIRRTSKLHPEQQQSLHSLINRLESFADEWEIGKLQSPEKSNEVLQVHTGLLRVSFQKLWTSGPWNAEDEVEAHRLLTSELMALEDVCLMTSAIHLSLMEWFDNRKVNWLFQAAQHAEAAIGQRALIALVWVFHLYRDRLQRYPELMARLQLMTEDSTFIDRLGHIYARLLMAQETEKIDKKMREEIIPEMIKSSSQLKNTNLRSLDEDEEYNEENPDWLDRIEASGLGEKLREMGELQQEGADVYMSTFAHLKSYPFFREEQNWFYPFTTRQPDVNRAINGAEATRQLVDTLTHLGFFSHGDKYSLFFTLQMLPQEQQSMIRGQFYTQVQQEVMDKLDEYNSRPDTIGLQYIQDLYRFFRLFGRRNEFRDIFHETLDLHRISYLAPLLSSPTRLMPIGDFYLRKERWEEAAELYAEVVASHEDFPEVECYQRWGYALQKCKKYAAAITAYHRAETLMPDSVWNQRHLAACYRLEGRFDKALTYYERVIEHCPNDRQLLYYQALCRMGAKQYEEALNGFFKLYLLDENNTKVLRGIARCSFVLRKPEQAGAYYERMLNTSPTSADYVQAGHMAWLRGQADRAIELYRQAAEKCNDREEFILLFAQDSEILERLGMNLAELPLLIDLIE